MSSRLCCESEANASDSQQILEDIYWIWCSLSKHMTSSFNYIQPFKMMFKFKYSITQLLVTRLYRDVADTLPVAVSDVHKPFKLVQGLSAI